MIVQIRDVGVVGAPGIADILVSDVIVIHGRHLPQSLAVRVHVVIGNGRGLRCVYVSIRIQVPVFCARSVGIMGMGERGDQAERTLFRVARIIVYAPTGLEAHLIIIFKLVGLLGDTCLLDREQVVIPPVHALLRLAPVRGPAEICRINVGCQAFLKTVQLIGAHKMHLAGQAGAIALEPQIMGKARGLRGKLGRVVIDPVA